MTLQVAEILKVADFNAAQFPAYFIYWLKSSIDHTYSDNVLKEHLYNPDDFEEVQDYEQFEDTVKAVQDLCRENEAGYFRIIF